MPLGLAYTCGRVEGGPHVPMGARIRPMKELCVPGHGVLREFCHNLQGGEFLREQLCSLNLKKEKRTEQKMEFREQDINKSLETERIQRVFFFPRAWCKDVSYQIVNGMQK